MYIATRAELASSNGGLMYAAGKTSTCNPSRQCGDAGGRVLWSHDYGHAWHEELPPIWYYDCIYTAMHDMSATRLERDACVVNGLMTNASNK